MFADHKLRFLERGTLTKAMHDCFTQKKKLFNKGDEVTKSPKNLKLKEAILVITGKSYEDEEFCMLVYVSSWKDQQLWLLLKQM